MNPEDIPPFMEINEIDKENGKWKIKSTKCMGLNEIVLIKAFEKNIRYLLQGVVEIQNIHQEIQYEEENPKTTKEYTLQSFINSSMAMDEESYAAYKDELKSYRQVFF